MLYRRQLLDATCACYKGSYERVDMLNADRMTALTNAFDSVLRDVTVKN
jgi:hypothetical protein